MEYNVKRKVEELIANLEDKKIQLWPDEDKLRYKGPEGSVDTEVISLLKKYKSEIMQILNETADIKIIPNEEEKFEKFPLTDIQEAYQIGRKQFFEQGGVPCNIYLELETASLNVNKVENVWNRLIERHGMLRTVFIDDGFQQMLKEVPQLKIKEVDLTGINEIERNNKLEKIRNEFGNRMFDISKWPLFDVIVSHQEEMDTMHFVIEFLIADWGSIKLLLDEFSILYSDIETQLPKIEINFRDYVFSYKKNKGTQKYYADKAYWLRRLDDFACAPELPVKTNSNSTKFSRLNHSLSIEEWGFLKEVAKKNQLTPSNIILAAYAATLERWCGQEKFCINLTLLTRPNTHKDIPLLIGDFTTTNLLEINWKTGANFLERTRQIQEQLFEDLDHKLFSGVEVLRELSRRNGVTLMPIVFTSAISEVENENDISIFNIGKNGLSKTPQVYIDCQVVNDHMGMHINWDYRKELFDEYLIEDMFESFIKVLHSIISDHQIVFLEEIIDIPRWHSELIKKQNNTYKKFPKRTLHEGIFNQINLDPSKVAIIDKNGCTTYFELINKSFGIANYLKNIGCGIGDTVAVIAEKSAEQIAAVLGILAVGAIYVPVDTSQPENRIRRILEKAEVNVILSDSKKTKNYINADITSIDISKIPVCSTFEWITGKTDRTAYIIYTSGSTGEPKGVEMSHYAAMNTIQDINDRISLDKTDILLGVSKLNFDLSVYDIFAILGVGGTLILPDENQINNPSALNNLIKKYKVTIWNSVPAIMQMLVEFVKINQKAITDYKIRIAMLSGDWIPLELPDNMLEIFSKVKILCMGGATEAGIWSNVYYYNALCSTWNSIPYGVPLSNQKYYILDKKLRYCPIGVKGELYISGDSLAKGYYNDDELTKKSFLENVITKERLYKTGDFGRYFAHGEIEFLGREDFQVKIRGHRIELMEIEKALYQHENVTKAAVILRDKGSRKYLEAFVVINNYSVVSEQDLLDHLKTIVPDYMIPSKLYIIDEMPLSANRKIDRKRLIDFSDSFEKTDRNNIKGKTERSSIEKMILKLITGILSEEVEPDVSFYEYGADSLIMAQMAGALQQELRELYKNEISYDVILRTILSYPTVVELSKHLESEFESSITEKESNNSNANIIVYDSCNNNDLIRVVLHAGLGTLNSFGYLIQNMQTIKEGKIIGIAIKDSEKYCSIPVDSLVKEIAKDYAECIANYKCKKVQVIGYCVGGMIALEVARILQEKDIDIVDFVLVDSHPICITVEDDIYLENIFINNFNISLSDVYNDLTREELEDAYQKVFERNPNFISQNAVKEIEDENDESLNKLKKLYLKLESKGQQERFKMYVEIIKNKNHRDMSLDMFGNMYNVFIHNFKGTQYEPEIYFGNIRFLLAEEEFGYIKGSSEKTLGFWKDICMGEIEVMPIPGNHISCMEEQKNAAVLASIINRGIITI